MDAILELQQQINKLSAELDRLRSFEWSPGGINFISPFLALPGLIGFWPMSSVQRSTGLAYDLSGQARNLTYNGNPTYNYHNSIVPYIALDGVGDFMSRADETDLDVLGTETIYAAAVRGLTMGGWFYANAVATIQGFMMKWNATGNQRSYLLDVTAGGVANGIISTDGIASTTVASGAVSAATWHNIVLRFTPSTELAVFLDGIKTTNVAAIPATIFNSTAALEIGRFGDGTNLLTGRASLCFLSGMALSDTLIASLFSQMRTAFGV